MTSLVTRFWALSLAGWLGCFFILRATGSWVAFALLGVFLALLGRRWRVVKAGLLRPSTRVMGWGALSGVLMVVATHLAYAALVELAPAVAAATRELFGLLHIAGFSPAQRATLIAVIASSEEILFRGPLPSATATWSGAEGPRAAFAHTALLTLAYALTTAPLGSPLLMLCALVCGALWAALRVATDSLIVPILAHVIWDIGVLFIWPLV